MASVFQVLVQSANTDPAGFATALNRFTTQEAASTTFRTRLPDKDKDIIIKGILARLKSGSSWGNKEFKDALFALRILSRERFALEPMQTPEAFTIFMSYFSASTEYNAAVREEALRVVINSIHSTSSAQTAFHEVQGPQLVVKLLLKTDPYVGEERFLLARILFLLSVENVANATTIAVTLNASEYIPKLLYAQLGLPRTNNSFTLSAIVHQSSAELLRVLYNLWTRVANNQTDVFQHAATLTCEMLQFVAPADTDFYDLQLLVINLFISAPKPAIAALMEMDKEKNNDPPMALRLLRVLERQMRLPKDRLSDEASPVVAALTNICAAHEPSRKLMRKELLPLADEKRRWPHEMKELRSKLIAQMTAIPFDLKNAVGEFMFTLCKRRAASLTKHVGYGSAAGIMAQHALLGQSQEPMMDESDGEPLDEAPSLGSGTRVEMTDEEKEEETAKLLDLFDKLNRNGLFKVDMASFGQQQVSTSSSSPQQASSQPSPQQPSSMSQSDTSSIMNGHLEEMQSSDDDD